jgi:fatty acid-binding protein DegV
MLMRLKELGLNSGKVIISHCINENAANTLKALIENDLPKAEVRIQPARGLCTFYAEIGGLLVGFEKM